MRIIVGVLLWLMLVSTMALGQETLLPLNSNPNLKHQRSDQPERNQHRRAAQNAITLPFVDDFSNRSHYPNEKYWIDSQAYVNSTMALNPPTIGVATFDGLKANGEPYRYAKNTQGPADTLTSREIDLSTFGPADSVILSFFIQPKGNGDPPGQRDTILLDFKVNDSTWDNVWYKLPASESPDTFSHVFVPLEASKYFNNDFQFRFRNYAALTGNVDHWHLDYVILDHGRSVVNSRLNDVAFDRPPRSLLRQYQSMPLNQFAGYEDQELADSIYASAANHFNEVKNTTFRYQAIENCTQTQLQSDFFQTINFPALTDTVLEEAIFADEIKNYVSGMGCDSLVIDTRYVLFNSPPDPATGFNDTIYHQQRFHNYFAYDDGTVERGYNVIGNNPYFAVKFVLNESDSLQAVRVHWPHVEKNLENELINLIVWDYIDMHNGNDDIVRYEQQLISPEYVDSLNGFTTYRLDSALYIEDSFYVGFQRSNGDTVQMGYDMNSFTPQRLFYFTSGTWKTSTFPGSAMVRPVMGEPLEPISGITKKPFDREQVAFYPNPVRDRLVLGDWEKVRGLRYELLNVSGQQLQHGIVDQQSIDVSELQKGIHLVRIMDPESGKAYYGKFVKVE